MLRRMGARRRPHRRSAIDQNRLPNKNEQSPHGYPCAVETLDARGQLPDGTQLVYGWNASNSANTRDRNASNSPDQRYDTLIHMQTKGTYTWEAAVPNGQYQVRLVAGDAQYVNSVYKINVENV